MVIDIQDISLNLTNYCLASCIHCNLCRQQNTVKLDEEMTLSDIKFLFNSPLLKNLKSIHITGGEPSLSPKMYYVAKILSETHPKVSMNTPVSGLYPYLMERLWRHIHKMLPQFRCDIAVEGPNVIVHESVRGFGTWEQAILTYKLLKKIGVPLQFEMTIYEENYEYITETFNLSQKYNVGFYLNFGRWSRRFGHDKDNFIYPTLEQQEIIWKQIDEIGWKNWRPFNKQKYELQKAYWQKKLVTFDCLMGQRSIDVDPYGYVYPCLMYPKDMLFGNIKNESLEEIMYGNKADEVFKSIKQRTCQPCPFTCLCHAKNLRIG